MLNTTSKYGALSETCFEGLVQGDKVKFKWHGSQKEYVGRIEIKNTIKYFVAEHNYEGDVLKPSCEGMRWYNELLSFYNFTEFEVVEDFKKRLER